MGIQPAVSGCLRPGLAGWGVGGGPGHTAAPASCLGGLMSDRETGGQGCCHRLQNGLGWGATDFAEGPPAVGGPACRKEMLPKREQRLQGLRTSSRPPWTGPLTQPL